MQLYRAARTSEAAKVLMTSDKARSGTMAGEATGEDDADVGWCACSEVPKDHNATLLRSQHPRECPQVPSQKN